ncbi:MAG: phosphoribosylformylglycinamidine cyclo-ligase [Candidatus Levybacteria bacterium]|nr:phosphoribosylformylglycinamidine cyclo-ligase [Candidatus Levybacteria bacterium]
MNKKQSITYSQVGDNYDTKDPIKKLALAAAAQTKKNLGKGYQEISDTRGESAFAIQIPGTNPFIATVIEGLGTKNLIADAMRKIEDPERSPAPSGAGRSRRVTGKTYYDVVGHDTVATIINDLVTIGAKPLVVHAYWAIEDNSWLQDTERMTDLINGWKNACDLAGAAWGGGETATMKQIVVPNTAEFAGSAVGIISSEKNLITDKRLKAGDRILLCRSNGVNANGISLTRAIAAKLSQGYATKLPNGELYGEALLTKTNIYAQLVQDLLDANINIHYISNITGHGMRKVMRARDNYKYVIEKIFEPQPVFTFIQEHAGLDDYEMYQTYNMGQDYVIFLASNDVQKAQEIVKKNGFESIDAGCVEQGERQVIIKPKNLVYKGETLNLR